MTGRRPWVRALAEGAVIVSSILLAFGIDAWWEGRNEAQREQRVLAALLLEFQKNEELLREARAEYEQRYLDAIRILEWLDRDGDRPATVEIQPWLMSLLQNTTYHLESGAHDALLASGELDLIRDETLRNRLAAWPSYVSEWTEEAKGVFAFVEDVLVPYFAGRLPLRSVQASFAPFPDGEQPPPIPAASLRPTALDYLAGSVDFDNLVYRRAQGAWYAMRDGETLRAQVSSILELIQSNLDP